jgi:hypothetical protein
MFASESFSFNAQNVDNDQLTVGRTDTVDGSNKGDQYFNKIAHRIVWASARHVRVLCSASIFYPVRSESLSR